MLRLSFQMFLFSHNAFLLIISLPFSMSFYLTDSNPLLSFNSQVREVHLYTGIYGIFFLLQYENISEMLLLLNPLSSSLFLTFFVLQKITDEGCTCSWAWMGGCQEVMLRPLTVSIRWKSLTNSMCGPNLTIWINLGPETAGELQRRCTYLCFCVSRCARAEIG